MFSPPLLFLSVHFQSLPSETFVLFSFSRSLFCHALSAGLCPVLTFILTSLPLSRFPASSGWSTPFSNSRNQAHWRKCHWRLSDLLGFPNYSSSSQVFLCRSLLPPYLLVPGRIESPFPSSPLRTIPVYDDVFWHTLVSLHCDPLALCVAWEHLLHPSQGLASSSSQHFSRRLSDFFPSLSVFFLQSLLSCSCSLWHVLTLSRVFPWLWVQHFFEDTSFGYFCIISDSLLKQNHTLSALTDVASLGIGTDIFCFVCSVSKYVLFL